MKYLSKILILLLSLTFIACNSEPTAESQSDQNQITTPVNKQSRATTNNKVDSKQLEKLKANAIKRGQKRSTKPAQTLEEYKAARAKENEKGIAVYNDLPTEYPAAYSNLSLPKIQGATINSVKERIHTQFKATEYILDLTLGDTSQEAIAFYKNKLQELGWELTNENTIPASKRTALAHRKEKAMASASFIELQENETIISLALMLKDL